MKIRFTIRTAFIVVTVVAISIAAVQHYRFENKWADQRQRMKEWSRGLSHTSLKSGVAHSVQKQDGPHLHFVIANAPVRVVGDGISFPAAGEIQHETLGFYIEPPGIWVPDIESAIRVWDAF